MCTPWLGLCLKTNRFIHLRASASAWVPGCMTMGLVTQRPVVRCHLTPGKHPQHRVNKSIYLSTTYVDSTSLAIQRVESVRTTYQDKIGVFKSICNTNSDIYYIR